MSDSSQLLSDLLVNLAAGAIFLVVVEVGLISFVLPRVLDRRDRKRWAATVKQALLGMVRQQNILVVRFASRAKQFRDDTRPFDPGVATVWVQTVLPKVFGELVPDAKALAERARDQAVLYLPALGPGMQRELVGWAAALEKLAKALDTASLRAGTYVLNPPIQRAEWDRVAKETVEALRTAFAALDRQTAQALNEADVAAQSETGSFDPNLWTSIREALVIAMASQRLAMKQIP